MIRYAISNGNPRRAATVYHTMLIIACVALVVGMFFPIFEYARFYYGKKPFDVQTAMSAPARPAPAPAAEAPVGEESEAAAPSEEVGTDEAPAPVDTAETPEDG